MPRQVSRLLSPSMQVHPKREKPTLEIHGDNAKSQDAYTFNGSSIQDIYLVTNHCVETKSKTYHSSVVDLQKVDEIKIALKNGYFVVDPFRVADKFFKFEKKLG